jgi:hypothetical protein
MSRYSHSAIAAGEIKNVHVAADAAISLSKTTGNESNLLDGITPTFAGWDTNPGTVAEMCRELDGDTALSQAGAITNPSTIVWDLGASKRCLVAFTATPAASFSVSDDGITYYVLSASSSGTTRVAKFRYLKYSRSTAGAVSQINVRVYRL